MTPAPDPVVRVLTGMAVAILTVILVVVLVGIASTPPLGDRLDRIERQFTYVSCLLLIPIEERVERGIAECQFEPSPLPDE